MILLKEIYRDQGLNLSGCTLERESAKAIIRRGQLLLLVHSAQGGYKFPGGGVNPGETDEQTLAREIREECGVRLLRIDGEFGQVVEYKRPLEPQFEVFKMTSRYYLCQVEEGDGKLRLDAYEAELGFRPVWVDLNAALQVNMALLRSSHQRVGSWLARELFILEKIKSILGEISTPQL